MVYDVFAAVFRGLFVWGIRAENMREYAFKDVSDTPLRCDAPSRLPLRFVFSCVVRHLDALPCRAHGV